MLNNISKIFFSTVVVLLTSNVYAQIKLEIAESLMRKSGLWKQLDSVQPQVQAGIEAQVGKMLNEHSDTKNDLLEAVQLAYGTKQLRERVQSTLSQQLSTATAETVTLWFDSGLGKQLTKAEEEVSDLEPQKMIENGTEIYQKLDKSRQTTINQLVVATNAAEFIYNLTVNSTVAVFQGARKFTPGLQAPSSKEIKAIFSTRKAEMLGQFTTLYRAVFAHTYQDFTDEQLSMYLKFYTSEHGKLFGDSTLSAMDVAMTTASEEFGVLLSGFTGVKK